MTNGKLKKVVSYVLIFIILFTIFTGIGLIRYRSIYNSTLHVTVKDIKISGTWITLTRVIWNPYKISVGVGSLYDSGPPFFIHYTDIDGNDVLYDMGSGCGEGFSFLPNYVKPGLTNDYYDLVFIEFQNLTDPSPHKSWIESNTLLDGHYIVIPNLLSCVATNYGSKNLKRYNATIIVEGTQTSIVYDILPGDFGKSHRLEMLYDSLLFSSLLSLVLIIIRERKCLAIQIKEFRNNR